MTSHVLHGNQVGKKPGKRQFVHIIMGLFLIAGLAVGCGGGGESAPKGSAATAPLQACELLTRAEAEAILEGTVDEPERKAKEDKESKSWMSMCTYYSPQKERGAGLLIQTSSADPVKALEAHTASLKEALGDAYKPQAIDGIGGAAIWDGSAKQLTIFQGAYKLVVTARGTRLEEDVALETAKSAAGKVLSKLPQ